MKRKSILSLLFVVLLGLLNAGCPKVKTTTGAACGSRARRCTVIIIPHPLTGTDFSGNDFNGQTVSGTSGIFDLANPWQPDSSEASNAVVKVTKDDGQIVQSTFATQLTSTGNITAVDKDTTPYVYVFQDPNDVSSFVTQSLVGQNNASFTIEFVVPIIQTDCEIPSGKYINHVRSSDSSGVTYLDSFNLNYSIPEGDVPFVVKSL